MTDLDAVRSMAAANGSVPWPVVLDLIDDLEDARDDAELLASTLLRAKNLGWVPAVHAEAVDVLARHTELGLATDRRPGDAIGA